MPTEISNVIGKVLDEIKLKSSAINIKSLYEILKNVLENQPHLEKIPRHCVYFNQPFTDSPTNLIKKKNLEIQEVLILSDSVSQNLDEEIKEKKFYQKKIEILREYQPVNNNLASEKDNQFDFLNYFLEKQIEELKLEIVQKDKLIESPDCSLKISHARKEILQKLRAKQEEIKEQNIIIEVLHKEREVIMEQVRQLRTSDLSRQLTRIFVFYFKLKKLQKERGDYSKKLEDLSYSHDQEINHLLAENNSLRAINQELLEELKTFVTSERKKSLDIEFSLVSNNNYLEFLPNIATATSPKTSSPTSETSPPKFENGFAEGNKI